MSNIQDTLKYLEKEGKIPTIGAFEVTEDLIADYFLAYAIVNNKISGTSSKSNTKFARRLAGLNLLKENINRGTKPTDIRAGHVYLISNPAFPIHYKIGVSFDVHKRLSGYQTYSPYRDFILEKYDFVVDKYKIEKLLLNHPLLIKANGEWVERSNAEQVFNDLATYNLDKYTGLW